MPEMQPTASALSKQNTPSFSAEVMTGLASWRRERMYVPFHWADSPDAFAAGREKLPIGAA
jgi:hypothetical protein